MEAENLDEGCEESVDVSDSGGDEVSDCSSDEVEETPEDSEEESVDTSDEDIEDTSEDEDEIPEDSEEESVDTSDEDIEDNSEDEDEIPEDSIEESVDTSDEGEDDTSEDGIDSMNEDVDSITEDVEGETPTDDAGDTESETPTDDVGDAEGETPTDDAGDMEGETGEEETEPDDDSTEDEEDETAEGEEETEDETTAGTSESDDSVISGTYQGAVNREGFSFNNIFQKINKGVSSIFNGKSDKKNTESRLQEIERKCVSEGFVKKADLKDFDPDVASVVTDAFKDAKKDFPDLDVNYIGTIESQVNGIRNTVASSYEEELKKANGDSFTDEHYRNIAQQYADSFIKNSGLDDSSGAFAWSLNIPKSMDPTGKLSMYNGVAINGKFASDNKGFTKSKVREVEVKHKPIGCDTPRATADHELGHEIDRLVGASKDSKINELYNKMIKDGNAKDVLSGYSKESVEEFVAECYSEYRNNPEPREYSKTVYNRLIELNKQRGGSGSK